MTVVHETRIDDIRLKRLPDGSVEMRCVVELLDVSGTRLRKYEASFSEAEGDNCKDARIFAKRLHRMVKEGLVKEPQGLDMSMVRQELVDRFGCCR